MIIATQIILMIAACLFFLGCLGSSNDRRGYLFLIGATVSIVLLLLSFRFFG